MRVLADRSCLFQSFPFCLLCFGVRETCGIGSTSGSRMSNSCDPKCQFKQFHLSPPGTVRSAGIKSISFTSHEAHIRIHPTAYRLFIVNTVPIEHCEISSFTSSTAERLYAETPEPECQTASEFWRNFNIQGLHKSYPSPDIIRVIKPRGAGGKSRVWAIEITYVILVGKPDGRRRPRKPRHR